LPSGDLTNPQKLDQERAHFEQLKTALSLSENAINNQVDRGDITKELGDKSGLRYNVNSTYSYKKALQRCVS
jgi:hypothetical protein